MLERPGGEEARSLNPVVGECNDGFLSGIRARPVHAEHVRAALDAASGGPVAAAEPGPLFEAVLDGVEEAVLNSLLAARTTTGFHGRTVPALPADRLLTALTAGPPPCHARAPLFEARQRPAAPEGA